jgi:hypothetical protein
MVFKEIKEVILIIPMIVGLILIVPVISFVRLVKFLRE